ncbi:MAG TPA: hypothetical protein VGI40_25765 [Pirellulaceae bacterium]|jgi:hypothetical protein
MNIRLGRMPWAIGWLFCASFVFISIVGANPPSADELALLVRQLGAADFAARESAAAQLSSAGEAAIGPLVNSICSDDPEAAWRATTTLQQIAVAADASRYARIAAVLRQENELRGDKLTALITDVGTRRATQRRNMAHEQIRAFGGRFGGDEPETPLAASKQTDVLLPAPPPDLPSEGQEPNAAAAVQTPVLIADAYVSPLLSRDVLNAPPRESLTIDENWRGGDEGLVPLCDLPDLSALNLSRAPLTDAALDTIAQMPAIQSLEIEDMPFSPAALTKFRTRQPRARVVARGAKLLEVSAER